MVYHLRMKGEKKVKKKAANKPGKPTTAKKLAHFIYETGIHRHTPRSAFWFLGDGKQSVAEHLFRTTMIAYALAHVTPGVDKARVVLLALVHDLGEGRTGDPNYVHQRYGRLAEREAVHDMVEGLPFAAEVIGLFDEQEEKATVEAKLVKDADQLEWIATLKEEEARGNPKAGSWIRHAILRLKTPEAKKIAKELLATHPDAWWFDKDDDWFIDRKEQLRKKRT